MAYEASFLNEDGSAFQSDGPDTENERLPHEWYKCVGLEEDLHRMNVVVELEYGVVLVLEGICRGYVMYIDIGKPWSKS